MPYVTLSGGLPLQIPTEGSRGWATYLVTYLWQKIVDHDHTTGKGNPIGTNAISAAAVTFAKMQDISTDKLLGRVSSGTGDVEEVTCTDFAQSLLDDASASAARTTLGLGTIATQDSNNVSLTGGSISGITITSLTGVTGVTGSSGSDMTIKGGTSDGTDNRAIFLAGGGAVASGRGGHVDVYGYDHATFPGVAAMTADGGVMILYTTENDAIQISTNGTLRYEIEGGGDLTAKTAGKGYNDGVTANATAAGTDLATATAITNRVTYFGTVASGTGGALPTTIPVGSIFRVHNFGANALEVYANTGHSIRQYAAGPADGPSITISPGRSRVFQGLTSTIWLHVRDEG